ncbi:hypothetical protein [Paraburkholderia lycopersici]|uniref:hypothetical protein n=1 Tax=Paraburkholderia lycopersici TaxID=416944 RepID=UPI0011613B7E
MKFDIVTERGLIGIVIEGYGTRHPPHGVGVAGHDRGAVRRRAVPGSDLESGILCGMQAAARRCRMPGEQIFPWEFARRGRTVRVNGEGAVTLDEAGLMLAAACAGLGLAFLTEWNVCGPEGWGARSRAGALDADARRHVPAGLRALIEMTREHADAVRARKEAPAWGGPWA